MPCYPMKYYFYRDIFINPSSCKSENHMKHACQVNYQTILTQCSCSCIHMMCWNCWIISALVDYFDFVLYSVLLTIHLPYVASMCSDVVYLLVFLPINLANLLLLFHDLYNWRVNNNLLSCALLCCCFLLLFHAMCCLPLSWCCCFMLCVMLLTIRCSVVNLLLFWLDAVSQCA
jgi:hypothetical protein